MSDQSIWKMLHLLHLYGRDDGSGNRGLSEAELCAGGVDCFSDTIQPAITGHAVERSAQGQYRLTTGVQTVLDRCVVGNRKWPNAAEMRPDFPSVFVVMPFSETWSGNVWNQLIAPAAAGANLDCVRGDMPLRVGDLTVTVWNAIVSAGLVLADVSSPNVNVFYELGLAHALGKDVFMLKQSGVVLAADFSGAHFYEYDRDNPAAAQTLLAEALKEWVRVNKADGVGALAR